MRRAAFAAIAVVAAAGLLTRSAAPVAACFCAFAPLEERVAASATILTGTVTDIIFDPPLTDPGPNESRRTIIVMNVERFLKGAGLAVAEIHEPGVVVITAEGGQPGGMSVSSCATFELKSTGRRYLLFLSQSSPPYTSPGSCSGSSPIFLGTDETLTAVEDILAGPGSLPATGGVLSASNCDPLLLPMVAAGSAPLALLLGAAFALARRGQA